MPASASPLADRLCVPAWALDLLLAGLGSVGCNGLAACLLAFAAHAPRLGPEPGAPRLGLTIDQPSLGLAAEVIPPRLGSEQDAPSLGDIDAFMLERVQATSGGRISWARLFTEYVDWCEGRGEAPAHVSAFGKRMDALSHELGRTVREDRGQVYFIGLGLKRLQLAAS